MYRLDLVCFAVPFRFDRAMMREAAEAAAAIVVVVADDAGRMLGFIIMHREGPEEDAYGYVVTIDVEPSVRRTGLGAAMLREAESQARLAGLARVGLHVAVANTGAIAFYELADYELVGVAEGFYLEAQQDALVYLKEL